MKVKNKNFIILLKKYSNAKNCNSKDEVPLKDVKKRFGDGVKIFDAMKIMFKAWKIGLNVKRKIYQTEVEPTVRYGKEVWGMRIDERHKIDVVELKCHMILLFFFSNFSFWIHKKELASLYISLSFSCKIRLSWFPACP